MKQPDRNKPPEFGKEASKTDEQIPVESKIVPRAYDIRQGLTILVICTGQIWTKHYKQLAEASNYFWTWFSPHDNSFKTLSSRLKGHRPNVVFLHGSDILLMKNVILYRLWQSAASQDIKWFRQESM